MTSRYGWKIYLEIFSHFQAQYFVVALLLLGLLLLTRRRPPVWIGLFCCAVLAVQIVPWYLPPRSLLSQPEPNLRVLVANINTQNRSYANVINLVRQEKPDLAVFMEVDDTWAEQFEAFSDLLPYSFGQAKPYNLGLLVYSRQPLVDSQIEFFGVEKNVSVVGKLAIAGQTISLVATHPYPPAKSSFFHLRNKQLDAIAQYLQTVKDPVVMVGDLNITMWSPYYKRFVNRTGLKNARAGFGILPTWPVRNAFFQTPLPTWMLSIPIDHCLLSPKLKAVDVRTGAETGSDHRPLIVDLRLAV